MSRLSHGDPQAIESLEHASRIPKAPRLERDVEGIRALSSLRVESSSKGQNISANELSRVVEHSA